MCTPETNITMYINYTSIKKSFPDKAKREFCPVTSTEPSTLPNNLIMFLSSVHSLILCNDYFKPSAVLSHLPFSLALLSDDNFTSELSVTNAQNGDETIPERLH